MGECRILPIPNRLAFRAWLQEHSQSEEECFLLLKRGEPKDDGSFYYLDAVEEALCFGWIDSVSTSADGQSVQRFSPRSKNSPWTELNKERARRLIHLGLMQPSGIAVLPAMGPRSFHLDEDVEMALKKARVYKIFRSFPSLYQRVRGYNVAFFKKRDPEAYQKALTNLIRYTKQGKMYGMWHDYGRLLNWDK